MRIATKTMAAPVERITRLTLIPPLKRGFQHLDKGLSIWSASDGKASLTPNGRTILLGFPQKQNGRHVESITLLKNAYITAKTWTTFMEAYLWTICGVLGQSLYTYMQTIASQQNVTIQHPCLSLSG